MQKASATVPGVNQLLSTDTSGIYANGPTDSGYGGAGPQLSGDGRYVAFDSHASNLVPNDTNGYNDVFVKDTLTGNVTLVSLNPSGVQYSDNSTVRGISYDGKHILFTNNYNGQLLVRDLGANTTTAVCQAILYCSSYGMRGGAISADGRYVTYASLDYPGHKYQAYVTDMKSNVTKLLSVDASGNIGNNDSYPGGISCDGGTITFTSNSTNLPGGSGGYMASFDLNGNLQLTKIDIGPSSQVSCNGNVIVSGSYGYPSYVKTYNRLTGQSTTLATGTLSEYVNSASLSDDGRYVALTTRLNLDSSYPATGAKNYYDAYLIDTKTSATHLLSFTAAGNKSGSIETQVSISADGSKVAYGYLTPSNTDSNHELISGTNTGTASTQVDIYTSMTGL